MANTLLEYYVKWHKQYCPTNPVPQDPDRFINELIPLYNHIIEMRSCFIQSQIESDNQEHRKLNVGLMIEAVLPLKEVFSYLKQEKVMKFSDALKREISTIYKSLEDGHAWLRRLEAGTAPIVRDLNKIKKIPELASTTFPITKDCFSDN